MSTIEEKLKLLLKTKTDIRNALKAKGVEISPDTPFSEYDVAIKAIQAGDLLLVKDMQELLDKGEVTEETKALIYNEETDIFEGIYIYIDKTWQLMPTQLTAKAENIAPGFKAYGPDGVVEGNFTNDADATSPDIMNGKIAYVQGQKVTGNYVPLDTSDATATAHDIISPKTAYRNGEKITGNIVMQADSLVGGMEHKLIPGFSVPYNNFDINDKYNIAICGTFQGTQIYLYNIENNKITTLIETINTSERILSAGISKDVDVLGHLILYYFTQVEGSQTGYMNAVAIDTTTKKTISGSKAKLYVFVDGIGWNEFGNIAVNPVYPNYVGVSKKIRSWGATNGHVYKYDSNAKTLTQTAFHSVGNGYPAGDYHCQWDSSGLVFAYGDTLTSYHNAQGANIIKFSNSAFTNYSHIATRNNRERTCLWNKNYYFSNNVLYNMSNTAIKTYSEIPMDFRYTWMWTYNNFLIISCGNNSYFRCYRIDENTFNLTLCFEMTPCSSLLGHLRYIGGVYLPQSQKHLYFHNSGSFYHMKLLDETIIPQSALIRNKILYNTEKATSTAADILNGKTAYNKDGQVSGTIPNNGAINRTMGNSAITIPAGYTSGGTINPPSFTSMSEYSTCLSISNNILA